MASHELGGGIKAERSSPFLEKKENSSLEDTNHQPEESTPHLGISSVRKDPLQPQRFISMNSKGEGPGEKKKKISLISIIYRSKKRKDR